MPRHRDYDSYDDYSDSPPRHRSDRHHDRDRDRRSKPAYKEEEIIKARGAVPVAAARRDALIRRQMSDDSIEEVRREFPPGGDPGYARRTKRRARSDTRGRYDDDYSDDDLYGGRRNKDKRHGDRRSGHRRRDYSSSSSESPKPRRRKSLGEQALAALGVGGLAGAAAGGGRDRDRSRDRDRDRGGRDRSRGGRRRRHSSSSSRSRSRSVDQQAKIQAAVKAALLAGATEAFRSRKEPGGWAGAKGKRVLTAAIGAGGIDGLVNGDKDPEKKGTRHTIEAVIGGLAGNRLINGGRDKSGDRGGSGRHGDRHGDKDSGGGGLEKLLGAGAAAAAGKALLNRARSKSRDRGRKEYSSDSDDSRGPPRGSKKRSKSVTDYARQGMAALGIGGDQKKDSRGSRRGYDDDHHSRGAREPRLRGGGGDGGYGVSSSSKSSSSSSSSSDIDSSSEDERKSRILGRRELLTAGLATVATIHAGHSVYRSIHARDVRHKELKEGKISPEEAQKKKSKAVLQDAASVGIAALGIKGAISEWKEVKEQREEHLRFEEERHKRQEKRLRILEDRIKYNEQPGYHQQKTIRPDNSDHTHLSPGLAYGRYP